MNESMSIKHKIAKVLATMGAFSLVLFVNFKIQNYVPPIIIPIFLLLGLIFYIMTFSKLNIKNINNEKLNNLTFKKNIQSEMFVLIIYLIILTGLFFFLIWLQNQLLSVDIIMTILVSITTFFFFFFLFKKSYLKKYFLISVLLFVIIHFILYFKEIRNEIFNIVNLEPPLGDIFPRNYEDGPCISNHAEGIYCE